MSDLEKELQRLKREAERDTAERTLARARDQYVATCYLDLPREIQGSPAPSGKPLQETVREAIIRALDEYFPSDEGGLSEEEVQAYVAREAEIREFWEELRVGEWTTGQMAQAVNRYVRDVGFLLGEEI
ncbi:MAG: hypothetical protein UY48_C0002G0005 [Candidatus Gottesmanbacteria bacterium GW2011_GWB1_49_7]|uniref:Uncharacterized protein n=1 Tax=Candidatus Gottesmanbacteria bacterium GW2011_GWB1_49_7 TaxID=1618448 RepID=A0A0G1Z3F2_9BACT|nr:MAG: hypothetical protein UY48_C0002G0005 [Candidatus Gottesmanbacteria bacterium GW2011_GWB1_49_7]